jgi:hypothetical protein
MSSQIAKLIARIAENLPEIQEDVMQGWIENPKGLQKFLSGLCPPVVEPARRWREKDGVIYFSITSDGTTGPQWIERLEGKRFRIGEYAKKVLRSDDFKSTDGVTTEIAVLKGELFDNNDRITSKIRDEAGKRKLVKPNAEISCLIREMFTDEEIEEMGLWAIVAMHEVVEIECGLRLLGSFRHDGGGWLGTFCAYPSSGWDLYFGFAFVAPQVSS